MQSETVYTVKWIQDKIFTSSSDTIWVFWIQLRMSAMEVATDADNQNLKKTNKKPQNSMLPDAFINKCASNAALFSFFFLQFSFWKMVF